MERISLKKIARAAVVLMETASPQHVMQATAALLVEQRRGRESALLMDEIAAELWRTRRQAAVTVQSARPLAAAAQEDMKRFLKTRLGADSVTIEETVDPRLRGGVVATTPLGTLDASVAGRLNHLRQL